MGRPDSIVASVADFSPGAASAVLWMTVMPESPATAWERFGLVAWQGCGPFAWGIDGAGNDLLGVWIMFPFFAASYAYFTFTTKIGRPGLWWLHLLGGLVWWGIGFVPLTLLLT